MSHSARGPAPTSVASSVASSSSAAAAAAAAAAAQQSQLEKQKQKYKCVSHYIVGKTIGEGTFGKVKKGIHKLTGVKVCFLWQILLFSNSNLIVVDSVCESDISDHRVHVNFSDSDVLISGGHQNSREGSNRRRCRCRACIARDSHSQADQSSQCHQTLRSC
jgi:3-oxoacyl-ACP reductase-like protein